MKVLKLTAFALFISVLASCNNGGGEATQNTMPVTQPQVAQPATPDTTAAQQPAANPAAAQAQGLPQQITDFLLKQFPGATVSYVETDADHGGMEYDVTLNDGTEVDFDRANQWESVDCHVKAVPAALVPGAISSYVKSNNQGLPITKISRKPNGYEIELNNGLELRFDPNGNFAGIDD